MAANTNAVVRATPRAVMAQDSVTRPNDTTQYTEGDAISDNATTATAAGAFTLTFDTAVGRALRTVDFVLHKSDHDVTTATFWLLIFDTLPAVAGWEDNAASAITDAEMLTCQGTVVFPKASWINVATGDVMTVSADIALIPTSASATFYGILIAGEAYTPAAQEVFSLTVKAIAE